MWLNGRGESRCERGEKRETDGENGGLTRGRVGNPFDSEQNSSKLEHYYLISIETFNFLSKLFKLCKRQGSTSKIPA